MLQLFSGIWKETQEKILWKKTKRRECRSGLVEVRVKYYYFEMAKFEVFMSGYVRKPR